MLRAPSGRIRSRLLERLFLSFPLLADGFALVTHQASKLYFIGFHVVVVILIVK